ncbi:hypothetical protein VOLCADRAFT_103955 [Volvox carteri f. nagariensis]|uniref:Transglutaminase-like domain-containing protein n=1 Tax=Volvox carteri f. nagariensis TaxID=3068 RepID=D8TQ95_VOLCA|nr:uncharacterized protein VOLCADRAFT_103955 [Volvox carteri f. nagariensis]EFJ50495.1 hypothetical protein VOLCADRAFT_103955 [Volvox carteri f. nagariensis]|eukprot:XP_002948620.1 hypothetical protein VOLCADRAFT_103955 [Volvox carteri f. nagariensis]
MDPDEALARMLQEEELRAIQAMQAQLQLQQHEQGGGTRGVSAAAHTNTTQFADRLHSMLDTALRCEDKALQERARAVMPLSRLRGAAEEAATLAPRLGPDVEAPAREDLLAKMLLRWFKTEFFTWVDTLPCHRCGSTATRFGGAAQPQPDDLAGGANRVELHHCSTCGTATRFPRYNDPGRLLQPGCRRGRCGEWANAFLLCCRAAGLTARYVSDWSDHVWTEYYSHRMRRWIHMDSCEASYDQPLLYEAGWGKAVSYVVAAGVWGLTDVTRRYTAQWRPEVLPRRTLVPERWLERRLDEMTTAIRARWSAPRRLVWLGRDAEERVVRSGCGAGFRRDLAAACVEPGVQLGPELLLSGPLRASNDSSGAAPRQALPGRQTGSLEWRQQRGETGSSSLTPAAAVAPPAVAAAPAARPPTSYRLAADEPSRMPYNGVFASAGRLSGGACRAAGHNETTEVVERLFDGRVDTKWLDFGAAGPGGSSWVEYRLPTDREPVVVVGYELVSANDCPERDPAEWRLEAVTEQDFTAGRHDTWMELDHRSIVRFPNRHSVLAFDLETPSPPCRRLRLRITATFNPRVANSVQLACWNLYGAVAVSSSVSSSDSSSGSGNRERINRSLRGLRDMVTAAAAAPPPPSLALLSRILENILREPQELRFRKVRCVKVSQILQAPAVAEVFMGYLRFRPLVAPVSATDGQNMGYVAAGEGDELRRGGHDVFMQKSNSQTTNTGNATSEGLTSSSVPSNTPVGIHHRPDAACRAVAVAEHQTDALSSTSDSIGTASVGSGHPLPSKLDSIDVAVIGADVAGLAAALAACRAIPGARVMLYDTALEPPTARDGGVLLSVNGLRALKALDANLYNRIATELSSPILEALWFDLEGELVRRTPLGQPSTISAAALTVRGGGASNKSRRRVAARRLVPKPSAGGNPVTPDPTPSAPPLVISLYDLQEALSEALPEEVQIYARHHLTQIEACSSSGGGVGGSSMMLRFAASRNGAPVRAVRTRVLVGADGPKSAVKRLQFDSPPELQHSHPSDQIVWRGRFTLRPRDPDFARLRNFSTACRTWVDLRAAPGADRTATLSPAGPNTYVWSASCPATLLENRGLRKSNEADAPYWRCLAMFEDFPQDFYAALRATSATAVVEYDTCRQPTPSAAAGLAAPWQWFSGPAALVGDAVYSLPVDDASSTALNLALEDAAVLGASVAQYGLTTRALQEYARQRGPRVSAILAAPPSAPERVRLREALFLPQTPTSTLPPAAVAAAPAVAADNLSLSSTVAAAVDSAAAAAAAVSSPTQPLAEILANAAAAAGASASASAAATASPLGGLQQAAAAPVRPYGGAARAVPPGPAPTALPQPTLSGPSSPIFSRPSGTAEEATAVAASLAGAGPSSAAASAAKLPPYEASSSPSNVWNSLMPTHGSSPAGGSDAAPALERKLREYCSAGTPLTVWQALLGAAPGKVHDLLASLPYNAAETPALVWMSLVRSKAASSSSPSTLPDAAANAVANATSVSGSHDAVPAASGSVAAGGSHGSPCTLLPRPVLKQKPAAGSAAAAYAAALPEEPSSAVQSQGVTGVVADGSSLPSSSPSATPPSSPQRLVSAAAVPAEATASTSRLEPPRRRRLRSQAGPVSGRWAGGDGGGSDGGKAATRYGKSRRSAAASAAASAASSPSVAAAAGPSKPKAKGPAAAAAAAKMTVSLSAAAALGGVIGAAGAGHMPMVDVATALHTHGAVAQFWEELNNLTLSSASLSSIDLP